MNMVVFRFSFLSFRHVDTPFNLRPDFCILSLLSEVPPHLWNGTSSATDDGYARGSKAQRLKGPSNPWNETESNTESKTKSNVVSCHSKKVKQNLCEFRVLRVLGVGVFLVFRRIRLKRKNTEAVASLEEK